MLNMAPADPEGRWAEPPPPKLAETPADPERPPRRPTRKAAKPKLPPRKGEDGYVFGDQSVKQAVSALKAGGLVLLTEDGEDGTRGALYASPKHATPEQLQFLLEHTGGIEVGLEPGRFRAVYSSLREIVLDNK